MKHPIKKSVKKSAKKIVKKFALPVGLSILPSFYSGSPETYISKKGFPIRVRRDKEKGMKTIKLHIERGRDEVRVYDNYIAVDICDYRLFMSIIQASVKRG